MLEEKTTIKVVKTLPVIKIWSQILIDIYKYTCISFLFQAKKYIDRQKTSTLYNNVA